MKVIPIAFFLHVLSTLTYVVIVRYGNANVLSAGIGEGCFDCRAEDIKLYTGIGDLW